MSGSEAITYDAEIAEWLRGIAPGWRVVDDICKPENLEMFIDAIKSYIDCGGCDVYFSSDYKKLRKIEILNLKPKES